MAHANSNRTTSTPEIDRILKENYLLIGEKPLARMIGKSSSFVRIRKRQLGLIVPREIIEKRIQDSLRKKGDTPCNKGKKQVEYMTPEAIERTKATRFKKGQKIHNEKLDKTVSIRRSKGYPYRYIKMSNSNWVLYHRYVWEQINGPVPEGYIVVFKDRNQENCTIENLELITLEENMSRNTIMRYPEELRMTLKLQKKLERLLINKSNA